jgi:hypothetical protein
MAAHWRGPKEDQHGVCGPRPGAHGPKGEFAAHHQDGEGHQERNGTGVIPRPSAWRPAAPDVAIRHLRRAINAGTHWYVALLQAMGKWDHARECIAGEWHTYLIQDEALDWLLLAERLAAEVWDLLPQTEVEALLFHGVLPLALTEEQVRESLGAWKYRAYLNFFYGVTVEEALLLATEQEMRRESALGAYQEGRGEDAYNRIYDASQCSLLAEFRGVPEVTEPVSIEFAEWKRFLYWLFKRRMQHCLPPRVASDTKKGFDEVRRQYVAAGRQTFRLWVDQEAPAESTS